MTMMPRYSSESALGENSATAAIMPQVFHFVLGYVAGFAVFAGAPMVMKFANLMGYGGMTAGMSGLPPILRKKIFGVPAVLLGPLAAAIAGRLYFLRGAKDLLLAVLAMGGGFAAAFLTHGIVGKWVLAHIS